MTREEAIEHLKNMKMPHDKFYEETNEINKTLIDKGNEALDMGIKALENQKTGHWEETTLANGRKGMKCSNCGREPIEDALYGYVYSDYCPNCGAKMEGE